MSLTLAKLQQLKRQAGGDIARSEPTDSSLRHALPRDARQGSGAPRAAQASIETLRQLLRIRTPTPALQPASHDRTLPGLEIAPGLHLREATLPDDTIPPTFCGAFDR